MLKICFFRSFLRSYVHGLLDLKVSATEPTYTYVCEFEGTVAHVTVCIEVVKYIYIYTVNSKLHLHVTRSSYFTVSKLAQTNN